MSALGHEPPATVLEFSPNTDADYNDTDRGTARPIVSLYESLFHLLGGGGGG